MHLYRLVVEYPEGSLEPGWEPPEWDEGRYEANPGPDAFGYEGPPFRWPRIRTYLSAASASTRAELLRSYGAVVTIEKSEPVTWL